MFDGDTEYCNASREIFMVIHCNAAREMFDGNTEYCNVSQEMFEVQSKPV